MRLPLELLERPLFQYIDADELIASLGGRATEEQRHTIKSLANQRLPPVVSEDALAAMIGINSGIIWSFLNRPQKHYRCFRIEKGRGHREIFAPRVGLKIIQKWIGHHLANAYEAPDHVFGFVPGRSHIDAASAHAGAQWAYSCDIENFFDSTPTERVHKALIEIGYDNPSATLISKLCTLGGHLPQGSPASPILSNLCFREVDSQLASLALTHKCVVSRYADDIVFSGSGQYPDGIDAELHRTFEETPWQLAPAKELRQPLKGRIKIHGLLIKEDGVRLPKGYRNRLRAYQHIVKTRGGNAAHYASLKGHLRYADFVAERTERPGDRFALLDEPENGAADNPAKENIEQDRDNISWLSSLTSWFKKI